MACLHSFLGCVQVVALYGLPFDKGALLTHWANMGVKTDEGPFCGNIKLSVV